MQIQYSYEEGKRSALKSFADPSVNLLDSFPSPSQIHLRLFAIHIASLATCSATGVPPPPLPRLHIPLPAISPLYRSGACC